MFSQNDEERVILELLGPVRPGDRFLDVGAADGETFSNTRALVERGWGGVYVEPAPSLAAKLLDNIDLWRPDGSAGGNLEVVTVAIVPDRAGSVVRLHEARGDLVSTLIDAHRAKWSEYVRKSGGGGFRSVLVGCVEWRDLDVSFDWDFRMLSVDAEGLSTSLIGVFPFAWTPLLEVVCFEGDVGPEAERTAVHLSEHGFTLAHRTAENLIYHRAPR